MVATLASRVQQRMDQLGLKPVHLAAKVPGMSESAISQFLGGITKGLKPHNLVDIAEALGAYHRPEAAADDLAGGHTFSPSNGVDPGACGISPDLPEWTRVK